MTTQTNEIDIWSEDGDDDAPREITLRMNGTNPDCPVTFYSDGKAVFSLGCYEIDEFCKALQELSP